LVLDLLEDRTLLSYSFANIADFGPGSFFSQPIMTGTLNDSGTVTFRASLWSGGEGSFTRDMDGNLGIIAITNDLISALPIGGRINNAGTVSFGANLRDGTQAIFTGRGQELSRITDTGPDSPFSSILPLAADVTNDETVAFRATLKGSGQTGVFTERAGEPPRILYLAGGRFTDLWSQNIQRTGNQVVFWATLSAGRDGLFRGDGVTTTTIATTCDTYSGFTPASVANDEGTVAFLANLKAGGQAIVTGDGTQLTTVAATGDVFSDFTGLVSINNDGQVAFAADLAAGGRGIFIVRGGVMDEIIGTGDSLFGSTVSSFPDTAFSPRALNNVGQFGFLANLADGRQVWVRADPDGAALGHGLQEVSLASPINQTPRTSVYVLVVTAEPAQPEGRNLSDVWQTRVSEDASPGEMTMERLFTQMLASDGRPAGVHERLLADFAADRLCEDLLANSALVG
jgi:hypothetical protein